MTNNIEKLYELTGVPKAGCKDKATGEPCTYGSERWQKCNAENMACPKENWDNAEPSFYPKKQLNLIIWLSSALIGQFYSYVSLNRFSDNFGYHCVGIGNCKSYHEQFEEALAGLFIQLWNDLTDKQKEEIKEILK